MLICLQSEQSFEVSVSSVGVNVKVEMCALSLFTNMFIHRSKRRIVRLKYITLTECVMT